MVMNARSEVNYDFLSKVLLIVILRLCFVPSLVYSDDAAYLGDGADVYPLEQSEIQLVSEKITITDYRGLNPNNKYPYRWFIEVEMHFKNHGPATEIQMGFPMQEESFHEDGSQFDPQFKTWVDGHEVPIEKKHGMPNPLKTETLFSEEVFAYKVHFNRGEMKRIAHSYNVGGYFSAVGDWKVSYILRTGALWKGSIESVHIYYKTHVSIARYLDCISPKEHEAILNNEELILHWKFVNYEPDEDLNVSGDQGYRGDQTIVSRYSLDSIMNSNKRLLTKASECHYRFIRNLVFASYGYPFNNPYIRAQFYYPGSAYKEDKDYSIGTISDSHLALLNYLEKIENWKLKVQQSRIAGILDDADLKVKYEEYDLTPKLIDYRNNRYLIVVGKDMIFVSAEDYIPVKKIRFADNLGLNQSMGVKAMVSPDSKFAAIRIDDKPKIFIIDLNKMEVTSSFEAKGDFQFSRDSKMLYSNNAAYSLTDGKIIKSWALPVLRSPYAGDNPTFSMVPGMTANNRLLFTVYTYSGAMKPIMLSTISGASSIIEDIIEGVDPPTVVRKIPWGRTYFSGSINKEGELLAGIIDITYTKYEPTERRFLLKIWRITESSFMPVYQRSIKPGSVIWVENNLFTVEGGKLYRYDLNDDDSIKATLIPLEGYRDGIIEGMFNPNPYQLICTYGRCWSLKTGRKVSPWYEVLDPFDKSNLIPLYEKQPSQVILRDFWS